MKGPGNQITTSNRPPTEEGSITDFKPAHKARNITTGVEAIVQWLSIAGDGDEYLTNYVYAYIKNFYPGNPDVARRYALRLLVHYIGDLMEPLHNEDKYDAVNISGDNGGNSFTLPNHYGAAELHAAYDIVMHS